MSRRIVLHEWITGGGYSGTDLPAGLAAEGRAMRRAVVDDLRQIGGLEPVVLLDPRFVGDEPGALAVPVGPGEAEAMLADWSRRADLTLVIAPETGGILARLEGIVNESGGQSLGSSLDAIRLCADKLALAQHLGRCHVPSPPTWLHDGTGPRPERNGRPTVIKPRDGAGAVETWRVEAADAAPSLNGREGEWVEQPWIAGEPMSASYLVSQDGAVTLVGVAWQHVAIVSGVVSYQGGRVPAPAELGAGEPLAAVRAVPGLRGYVGVDFVRTPVGQSLVIEINPRLTTSYVGLRAFHPPGAILRAWIDRATGINKSSLIYSPGRNGPWGTFAFGKDGSTLGRDRLDDH